MEIFTHSHNCTLINNAVIKWKLNACWNLICNLILLRTFKQPKFSSTTFTMRKKKKGKKLAVLYIKTYGNSWQVFLCKSYTELIIRKHNYLKCEWCCDLSAFEDAYRSKIQRFDLDSLMSEQFLRSWIGPYSSCWILLQIRARLGRLARINEKLIAYYFIDYINEWIYRRLENRL